MWVKKSRSKDGRAVVYCPLIEAGAKEVGIVAVISFQAGSPRDCWNFHELLEDHQVSRFKHSLWIHDVFSSFSFSSNVRDCFFNLCLNGGGWARCNTRILCTESYFLFWSCYYDTHIYIHLTGFDVCWIWKRSNLK